MSLFPVVKFILMVHGLSILSAVFHFPMKTEMLLPDDLQPASAKIFKRQERVTLTQPTKRRRGCKTTLIKNRSKCIHGSTPKKCSKFTFHSINTVFLSLSTFEFKGKISNLNQIESNVLANPQDIPMCNIFAIPTNPLEIWPQYGKKPKSSGSEINPIFKYEMCIFFALEIQCVTKVGS